MAAKTSTVHRLKVTLRRVRPPVWRRIEVASTTTLHQLSAELEAAMGWFGGHLHSFDAAGVIYQSPSDEDFAWRPMKDERTAALATVLSRVGAKMRWDYDFGDGWEHDVVVEAIEPAANDVVYPRCIAGRRACPPEDCGGPWGYTNLLEVLADPAHPEHASMLEWAPMEFDPARFDPAHATDAMRQAEPWNLD
jgi:hypothetical protein